MCATTGNQPHIRPIRPSDERTVTRASLGVRCTRYRAIARAHKHTRTHTRPGKRPGAAESESQPAARSFRNAHAPATFPAAAATPAASLLSSRVLKQPALLLDRLAARHLRVGAETRSRRRDQRGLDPVRRSRRSRRSCHGGSASRLVRLRSIPCGHCAGHGWSRYRSLRLRRLIEQGGFESVVLRGA